MSIGSSSSRNLKPESPYYGYLSKNNLNKLKYAKNSFKRTKEQSRKKMFNTTIFDGGYHVPKPKAGRKESFRTTTDISDDVNSCNLSVDYRNNKT